MPQLRLFVAATHLQRESDGKLEANFQREIGDDTQAIK
jgi:hypothetical protein